MTTPSAALSACAEHLLDPSFAYDFLPRRAPRAHREATSASRGRFAKRCSSRSIPCAARPEKTTRRLRSPRT